MGLQIPTPVQDVPPPGGFRPIAYKRNMKPGGPSSLVMAVGSVALFSFGMYKVVMANRTRRVWSREEADIRLAILPFLAAESDIQQHHIKSTLTQKESMLMAGVSGWEAGATVYNKRWMAPMELLAVPNSYKTVFKQHF